MTKKEVAKKNAKLLKKYLSDEVLEFKVLRETEEFFEIEIMGNPLSVNKLIDGIVSVNSLILIREYAEVVYRGIYSNRILELKSICYEKICYFEFKTLPLSKELYLAIFSLDSEGEKKPFTSIKIVVDSPHLNNYFHITLTLFKESKKITDLFKEVKKRIIVEEDEIVMNFSSLEFLFESEGFDSRYFFMNFSPFAYKFPDGFYNNPETFKRSKFSFNIGTLRTTSALLDGTKELDTNANSVSFKDVYCLDDILEQFRELGELITNYEKYEERGIHLPYGVLLIGEPGTGKTLLTNAFINEFKLKRFEYVQPSFKESRYVGSLEDTFNQARGNKPSVIIIDEIDKIEINSALFQQLNGQIENNGVLVIASANSTYKLNEALLRPGRFDRRIIFKTLSKEAIKEMFKIKLEKKKVPYDLDFDVIVSLIPSVSGAHIETYINEALLKMVSQRKSVLTNDILLNAIEFVDLGYTSPYKYKEEAKEQVRIHESGHAVVAAFLNGPETIIQINTIPTAFGGGYVKVANDETTFLDNNSLLNKIKIGLGGIVAEKLFTNSISLGASSDLISVRRICERMIVDYGHANISSITTGMFDSELLRGTESAKDDVINESKRMIEEAETEVRRILVENEELVWKIVQALRENPKLLKREFLQIYKREN